MKLLTDDEARETDVMIFISCARLAQTLKQAGEVTDADQVIGFRIMKEGNGGIYIHINTDPERTHDVYPRRYLYDK